MNDWIPPKEPHTNDPRFPFDMVKRNPVKDGKPQLCKKRPPLQKAKPSTPKEQFEAMCAKLLALIDKFNDATMKCKVVAAGTDQKKKDAARQTYDAAVAALNQFMGRTAGTSKPGYQQFLKPGSFKTEVVLSYGFVLAIRAFGEPKMKAMSGVFKGGPSSSWTSSSSYYCVY